MTKNIAVIIFLAEVFGIGVFDVDGIGVEMIGVGGGGPGGFAGVGLGWITGLIVVGVDKVGESVFTGKVSRSNSVVTCFVAAGSLVRFSHSTIPLHQ